jgi:hypothetical protein
MRRTSKLAQVFSVNGNFVPTKASLKLLVNNPDKTDFFDLSQENIIDANNFYAVSLFTNNIFVSDTVSGYSGSGYVVVPSAVYAAPGAITNFSIIEFPVKDSGNHDVYLRVNKLAAGNIDYQILIDDAVALNGPFAAAGGVWEWIGPLSINLADSNEHDLGIRIGTTDALLDQVAIDPVVAPVGASAKIFTDAPYITAHVGLYNINVDYQPTTPLYIHDFKTTRENMKQSDWYNFDLNPIDDGVSITYDDSFAIVLSSSGSDDDNFLVWENFDSNADGYTSEPSAINE